MSSIQLRQLPDGKWYKFGEGPPVEATAEETSVWQAAQEAMVEKLGSPKSSWQRVVDLAKWTAVFATITGAVMVYLNAFFNVCLYSGLGLLHYKGPLFDINVDGVQIFLKIVISSSASLGLAWFAWSIYRFLIDTRRFKHVSQTRIVVITLLTLVLAGAYFVVTVFIMPQLFHRAMLSTLAAVQFLTFFAWFLVRKQLRDWPDFVSKGLQVVCSMLLICVWVFGLLWLYPWRYGRFLSHEILVGKKAFPEVTVITIDRVFMSDQVTEHQISDGAWAYRSAEINVPGQTSPVPSLQYIGEDNDFVYVLDWGAASVCAIPSSAVSQIIFSSGQWRDTPIDEIRFPSQTPTATSTTP